MLDPVNTAFAMLLAVILPLAAIPRDRLYALAAWAGLALSVVVTTLVAHRGSDADIYINVAYDTAFAAACAGGFIRTRHKWLLWVFLTGVLIVINHLLYLSFQALAPANIGRRTDYWIAYNALFLVQFIILAGHGGHYAVSNILRRLSGNSVSPSLVDRKADRERDS